MKEFFVPNDELQREIQSFLRKYPRYQEQLYTPFESSESFTSSEEEEVETSTTFSK